MTIAASIMAPIAMAITAEAHDVGTKAEGLHRRKRHEMPTGSMMIATSALRTCSKNRSSQGNDDTLFDQGGFSVLDAESISLERYRPARSRHTARQTL